MSKKRTGENTIFPLAKKPNLGYHRAQVDDFLSEVKEAFENPGSNPRVTSSRIRNRSFSLKKSGYDTRFVDRALDRLEELFFDRERNGFISERGRGEWQLLVENLLLDITGRAKRERGQRFTRSSIFAHGYQIKQVDAVVDQLTRSFQKNISVAAKQVRNVKFHPQRGGYDEAQVDAYLDAAVEYILALKN